MTEDNPLSRKGFFGQVGTFVRRGLSNHLDYKLAKMLPAPIRPPGALEEVEFLATCTRCNACVDACPYFAIARMPTEAGLAAKTPFLNPATTACQLCPDLPCITACPTGALVPTDLRQIRMGQARINTETCLTHRDRVCTFCYDACPLPEEAITIGPEFHPRILDGCVGCGLCQRSCPTLPDSIQVFSPMRSAAMDLAEDPYRGLFPNQQDASEPAEDGEVEAVTAFPPGDAETAQSRPAQPSKELNLPRLRESVRDRIDRFIARRNQVKQAREARRRSNRGPH